jgi:hypothetical protein
MLSGCSGPQGGIGQWRPKPTGEDPDLNQSSSESEESVEDFSVEIFKFSSKTTPPKGVTHSPQMKSAAPVSKGNGMRPYTSRLRPHMQ